MADDLNAQMIEFVESVTAAMGLSLEVSVEPIEDGTRIVIEGAGSEILRAAPGGGTRRAAASR